MAGRLRTIDARTLADAVLEPPGYAVKDLLVQGLHILAGAPKTGKSWLALWLCQQVAGGEKVWGHPTQQGTVLYLCLEDGYHRLQDRLELWRMAWPDRSKPSSGNTGGCR